MDKKRKRQERGKKRRLTTHSAAQDEGSHREGQKRNKTSRGCGGYVLLLLSCVYLIQV